MSSVAFIGTREYDQLPGPWRELYERAVVRAVSAGCLVRTGAAPGADQAAAELALSQSGQLHLYLPWLAYEESWVRAMDLAYPLQVMVSVYEPGPRPLTGRDPCKTWRESVDTYHPNPGALTNGARRLHARNYGIVADAACVVALPPRPGAGGTGQGIRIAAALGTRCYDLADHKHRFALEERLAT